MANIGDLVVHLDADTTGLEAGMTRAQRATKQFSQSARRAAGGFSRIARESQAAVPPIGNLTSLLGTLTGYLGARQVIQYADAWNNAANQLRQVTDTAEELAGVQETLMGVANDTRSEFESTANLYSRLARSTTEMGLSQKELIGLTKTINQSFAVSGATAGEAAAAITQLSQGLAAGALRGDEFNSVSEQAPALMRAISESLDMTIGELREFAAEGGITAEIVVNALQESADAIEDDFGKAVATFGQQMTVARNNMLQFVGGSEDLNEALSNLGDTAITLSENLDKVMNVAVALAGVLAGRVIGRIVALGMQMRTAAGAATALKTAMAFLGGPAGVAVAVTVGIGSLIDALGLLRDHSQEAKDSVSLLNDELSEMNANSIDAAMIEITSRMFELQKTAASAREEIEALNNANNTPGPFRNSMAQGVGAEERRELLETATGAESELGALQERMDQLREFSDGLGKSAESANEASKGADTLTESTNNAASALDKFSASMSPEVESILDRAGPGATIDENGMIRDAFGNFNRILQRELDSEIKDQINEFSAEKNLDRGLEAAAQRFIDGAGEAVSKAWSSVSGGGKGGIIPTGDQDSVPALAGAAKSASSAMQGSNSGPGKNLGTLKLVSEKGGTIDVEANADRLTGWLANTLSGNAAAS